MYHTQETTNSVENVKPVYVLRNAIQTPDKTILRSYSRWDYVPHMDTVSGELYFTDGGPWGLSYRRSVNVVPYVDMAVTTADAFELQREAFVWGTYGKDGKQKKTYVELRHMTDEHIWAVLKTQEHIYSTYVEDLFVSELEYRQLNNITIED